MAYLFYEDKSKVSFDDAIDPYIDDLKDACWRWLE